VNNTVLDGADGSFRAVADLQFGKESLQVSSNRIFRHEYGGTNFLVATAFD